MPKTVTFPAAPLTPFAFSDAAEVGLVNLMLSVAGRGLAFAGEHEAPADNPVEAVSRVAVDAHLTSRSGSRDFQDKVTDKFIDSSVVELGPLNDFMGHEHSLGQQLS